MSKRSDKRRRKAQATRSAHPLNVEPDQIASIYYSEAGLLKRLDYDRSQFDEMYAANPQLATYSVAAHAAFEHVPGWTGDTHIAALLDNETRSAMDLGTEIHRQIEQHVIMSGDMITGGPHTNIEIEKRLIAWYQAAWYRELMYAVYGVNPPEKKPEKPLDTGRNPAKETP
jgi:hypothetical protein